MQIRMQYYSESRYIMANLKKKSFMFVFDNNPIIPDTIGNSILFPFLVH